MLETKEKQRDMKPEGRRKKRW